MGDTLRPPPPSYELPKCEACGKQTYCCVARLANDISWYLCPEVCMPALMEEARGWLKREQRHNELLRDAGEDDEDETEVEATARGDAFLASLREGGNTFLAALSEESRPALTPELSGVDADAHATIDQHHQARLTLRPERR